MRTINLGIRELQRSAARVLRLLEEEGTGVVISRHGKPLAVLVPIDMAAGWAILNRPLEVAALDGPGIGDFVDVGGLRMSSELGIVMEAAGPMVRGRVSSLVGRVVAGGGAFGRLAMRVGGNWALLDFDGPEQPVHLVALDQYRSLRAWLINGASQPM